MFGPQLGASLPVVGQPGIARLGSIDHNQRGKVGGPLPGCQPGPPGHQPGMLAIHYRGHTIPTAGLTPAVALNRTLIIHRQQPLAGLGPGFDNWLYAGLHGANLVKGQLAGWPRTANFGLCPGQGLKLKAIRVWSVWRWAWIGSPLQSANTIQFCLHRFAGRLRVVYLAGFSPDSFATCRPLVISFQGKPAGISLLNRFTAVATAESVTGSSQGFPGPCRSS